METVNNHNYIQSKNLNLLPNSVNKIVTKTPQITYEFGGGTSYFATRSNSQDNGPQHQQIQNQQDEIKLSEEME